MCAHKERFNYFCDIQFSLQVILFFTADGFAVGRQRLCSLEITANVGILTLGSLLVKRQMQENASMNILQPVCDGAQVQVVCMKNRNESIHKSWKIEIIGLFFLGTSHMSAFFF